MKKSVVIDVRPPVHFGIVHLPEAVNIPLKAMERDSTQAKELCDTKKKVFVMCRRGNDSRKATELLLKNCGATNAINVEGGIEAYSREIDPTLPLY